MSERIQSTRDLKTLLTVQAEFGLPCNALQVNGGLIVPTMPLIQDGLHIYTFNEVGVQDEQLTNQWMTLQTNVAYLTNKQTPFAHIGDGIAMAAQAAFHAGTEFARTVGGTRIVLPEEVGFSPSYTATKEITLGKHTFKYNVWVPEIDRMPRAFDLTLQPSNGKRRIFRQIFTPLEINYA